MEMSDRERLDGPPSLDRTIDAVLREMAASEPPAALHHAVMARIERREANGAVARPWGTRRWSLAWIEGTALAALAIVLVAVWLRSPAPAPAPIGSDASRTSATGPAERSVAAVTTPPSPPARGDALPGASTPLAPAVAVLVGHTRQTFTLAPVPPPALDHKAVSGEAPEAGEAEGRTEEESLSIPPLTIDPLAPPPPVVIPEIEIKPIVVPSIDIPTIDIKPLDLAPASGRVDRGTSRQE